MSRKRVYGVAGVTSYVKPNNNGRIDNPAEVERFLEGFDDKTTLKEYLATIIEVDDIAALTAELLDSLRAGDKVVKVTGTKKHAYTVAYKDDVRGEASLVYADHENIEEVYYEKQEGAWTHIQTDTTPLNAERFAEIDELVGDRTLKSLERDEEGMVYGLYQTTGTDSQESNDNQTNEQ